MPVPTVQEINDLKEDIDDAEAIVNGFVSVDTRLGGTKQSLSQLLSNVTHGTITAYSPTTTYTTIDQWVSYVDTSVSPQTTIVYRPIPSALPIAPTSPLTTAPDTNKWVAAAGYKLGDRIHPSVSTYAELRALPSSSIPDGTVIPVTDDGIAGDFVVKTGTVTDNGGTLIVFTDDSNRYAERVYNGDINAFWFGCAGDGVTDDSEAINNALAYLHDSNKGSVYLPGNYTYLIESNILVGRGMRLRGDGYGTDIVGNGAGVIVTNSLIGTNVYSSLKSLRIRRNDASGIGLEFNGDNVSGPVTRWEIEDIYLIRTDAQNGTGLSVSGSWIPTIKGLYVSGWDKNIDINQNGPDYSWGLNSAAFIGGHSEGANVGLEITACIGLSFYGFTIETNDTVGARIDNARNVYFDPSSYIEGNGKGADGDIVIGQTTACYNVNISSYFNATSSGSNSHAIFAHQCIALNIENARFENYTAEPISIETAGGSVTGFAKNCSKDSPTTIGMVDVVTNAADRFNYSDADILLKETELTISSGAITITSNVHIVDTEGDASSDSLTTINGGQRGMRLILTAANSTRDIVITESSTINVPGGSVTLDHADDVVELIYHETLSKWLMVSFSDNAT